MIVCSRITFINVHSKMEIFGIGFKKAKIYACGSGTIIIVKIKRERRGKIRGAPALFRIPNAHPAFLLDKKGIM